MSFTKNAVDTTLVGQTGTDEFVGSNSPVLTTPSLGDAACDSLTVTGAGTLPTSDGAMDEVMTTTGGGVWYFKAAAGGTITGGANLGGGVDTFFDISGSIMRFNTFAAGANINFSTVGNLTTVSASGAGITFPYLQAFWVSQNNGSDGALGTSIDTPFLTLGFAIAQAGVTPTVINLVDSFTNTETIVTSGLGQTIYINASATIFNGSITNSINDKMYIYAPQVGGITNSGLISIHADQILSLVSTGAISYAFLDTILMNGLDLSGSTVCHLSCNSASSITNDSSATLNGTLGGTLPGAQGDQQISGNLLASSVSFTPTTQGIVGTPNADDAGSGYVGEYIASQVLLGSAISLTTTTPTNVTSIVLTAGDWDISGNVSVIVSAGSFSFSAAWTSLTSATLPDPAFRGGLNVPSTFDNYICIPLLRVSISTLTTVYLSCQANFLSGTVTACGQIQARRIR